MQMQLKIKGVKDGSFKGDDGQDIAYTWVKAETEDGLTIEFGSKRSVSDFTVGETDNVEIEKTEKYNSEGKMVGYKYKEVL